MKQKISINELIRRAKGSVNEKTYNINTMPGTNFREFVRVMLYMATLASSTRVPSTFGYVLTDEVAKTDLEFEIVIKARTHIYKNSSAIIQ